MQAVMEERPGARAPGLVRGSPPFVVRRYQLRRLRLTADAAARPSNASVPGAGITLDMGTGIDAEPEPPDRSNAICGMRSSVVARRGPDGGLRQARLGRVFVGRHAGHGPSTTSMVGTAHPTRV